MQDMSHFCKRKRPNITFLLMEHHFFFFSYSPPHIRCSSDPKPGSPGFGSYQFSQFFLAFVKWRPNGHPFLYSVSSKGGLHSVWFSHSNTGTPGFLYLSHYVVFQGKK